MNINVLYVFLGFIIGILVIIIFSQPKLIFKYPNLNSSKKYVDEDGTCYVYKPNKIPCSDINSYK